MMYGMQRIFPYGQIDFHCINVKSIWDNLKIFGFLMKILHKFYLREIFLFIISTNDRSPRKQHFYKQKNIFYCNTMYSWMGLNSPGGTRFSGLCGRAIYLAPNGYGSYFDNAICI